MPKVIRDKLGPIPDSHFENEPTYPPKNGRRYPKKCLDWLEKEHGSDKYRPGDVVGG